MTTLAFVNFLLVKIFPTLIRQNFLPSKFCTIRYIPSLNHLSSLYTAAPAMDTPSLSTVTVAVDSSLTLSCTSRGSPPDTFTWRKDNGPTVLQSTSINAVDHTSTSAVFRANYSIDSVTTSDSGTYTCTITNPIGNNSSTFTVVVIGKLLISIWR